MDSCNDISPDRDNDGDATRRSVSRTTVASYEALCSTAERLQRTSRRVNSEGAAWRRRRRRPAPARRTTFAPRYCPLSRSHPFSPLAHCVRSLSPSLLLPTRFVSLDPAGRPLTRLTLSLPPLVPYRSRSCSPRSLCICRAPFSRRCRVPSPFVTRQQVLPRTPRLFWSLVAASFLRHPRRDGCCASPLQPLPPPPVPPPPHSFHRTASTATDSPMLSSPASSSTSSCVYFPLSPSRPLTNWSRCSMRASGWRTRLTRASRGVEERDASLRCAAPEPEKRTTAKCTTNYASVCPTSRRN
ncbi:hypothetical protein PUN28_004778 [Cardiocondyla obscurior]|uniref:Uncharacterized protein n=1 Tax=Cardiocondyla obscurior TaxID=286306 RepID=A0AAW2GED2_9HYME